MSQKLKPDAHTLEQVNAQILEMQKINIELKESNQALTEQFQKIESAIKEKEKLKQDIQQRMGELMHKVEEEIKMKANSFPDIRLQLLIKAEESINPPKKA